MATRYQKLRITDALTVDHGRSGGFHGGLAEAVLILSISLPSAAAGFGVSFTVGLAAFLAFVATVGPGRFYRLQRRVARLSTDLSTARQMAAGIRDARAGIRDARPGIRDAENGDQGRIRRGSGTPENGDQGRFLLRSPEPARPPAPLTRARVFTLLTFCLTSFTRPARSPPGHAAGPPAAPGVELTRNGVRFAHGHFRAGGCRPRTPRKGGACGAAQAL